MPLQAFWVSLGMVFLAELGDKTQLVALSLAARFRTRVVLIGIFTATLTVHILSVALGGCAGKCLPQDWISFLAGLAFVGFGFWTLRGDCFDEKSCKSRRCPSPFWLVTITFFLAELGDKTMLSTVTLATNPDYHILLVWIGSSLGMVVSDGFAIAAGRILGTRLPYRVIRIGAAGIFFVFGVWSALQGAQTLPTAVLILGAAATAIMVLFFVRSTRREIARSADPDLEPAPGEEELVAADRR